MKQKTNFSFEVQYLASSDRSQDHLTEVMATLEPSLLQLFTAQDGKASVVVSNSHKGSSNKIVELTTSLKDSQVVEILQAFAEQNGVAVSALE